MDSRAELDAVFASADSRNKLADTILREVFPKAPTSTVKGAVASWAKDLDAMRPEALTLDYVERLKNHFGSSATTKLRRAVEKREGRASAD